MTDENYIPRPGTRLAAILAVLYAIDEELDSATLATRCDVNQGGLSTLTHEAVLHGFVLYRIAEGRHKLWRRGLRPLPDGYVEANLPRAAASAPVPMVTASLPSEPDTEDGFRFRTFPDGSLVIDAPGKMGIVFGPGTTRRLARFLSEAKET